MKSTFFLEHSISFVEQLINSQNVYTLYILLRRLVSLVQDAGLSIRNVERRGELRMGVILGQNRPEPDLRRLRSAGPVQTPVQGAAAGRPK